MSEHKTCKACGVNKSIDEYTFNGPNRGLNARCKECRKVYARTVRAVFRNAYRNHKAPNYTLDEFEAHFKEQFDFKLAYQKWQAWGYQRCHYPRFKRINKKAQFTLDNLELKPLNVTFS